MDKPQSPQQDDRGYAPGGGYGDSGTFPADDYRWRSTAARGYGSQDEFNRHPEDQFRRSAGGGERDRPGAQRIPRGWHGHAEGHAQASPRGSAERVSSAGDVEDVGYRGLAYRDH